MTSSGPYIGCAGWSIPSGHAALFGAGDSMLSRYATRFNAVEINSSFYRPHQRKTYQRWAESVPADFRFSVKLPKLISHELALRRSGAALERFFDEIAGLGDKLAGVLLQLPPSSAFDARVAQQFFAMLRRRYAGAVACEPRHRSWFHPGPEQLCDRFRIAREGVLRRSLCESSAAAGEKNEHGGAKQKERFLHRVRVSFPL